MSDTIRVLIVDDHAMVRDGLRAWIDSQPQIEVAGEAGDGVEALSQYRALHPDVVLIDLVMPRMDGIEAIREICAEDSEARILVLTSFVEDEKVFAAIKAGAMGYLLKDCSPEELLQSIQEVYRGEPALHPSVARKLIREVVQASPQMPASPTPLTAPEMKVLQLVGQGMTNQEIAERLNLSQRTVRNYVSAILSKLHLANRVQAALYALREGLADLEDGR